MRNIIIIAALLLTSCTQTTRVVKVVCWPVEAGMPEENAKYGGYTLECDEPTEQETREFFGDYFEKPHWEEGR